MIIGQRSNGKTYGVLKYALEQYFAGNGRLGIIRRWEEDFRGKQASTMFDALIENHVVSSLSKGKDFLEKVRLWYHYLYMPNFNWSFVHK